MNWFNRLNKEGPGISKNEPEKKGLALFWWIIKNNFFKLIALNLVFVVSTIPVVTIGPALKGLNKVTMNLARKSPSSPLSDFWDEFKSDFLKIMLLGLAELILLLGFGYLAFFSIRSGTGQFITIIASGFALLFFHTVLSIGMYLFKGLAIIDLPIKQQIKNAVLLTLMSIKELLLIFVLVVIPTYFLIVQFVIGIPLFLFLMFALNSLITSLIANGVFVKFVLKKDDN